MRPINLDAFSPSIVDDVTDVTDATYKNIEGKPFFITQLQFSGILNLNLCLNYSGSMGEGRRGRATDNGGRREWPSNGRSSNHQSLLLHMRMKAVNQRAVGFNLELL